MKKIPENILCVCYGNGDRSPLMAAVLGLYLKNAGHNSKVESAGVLESAKNGGPASSFGITSAKRIGLNISDHKKRWVGSLDLSKYDLFVCVDKNAVINLLGRDVPLEKMCSMDIPDPWPSNDQRDHDETAEIVVAKMYRVVTRYFTVE